MAKNYLELQKKLEQTEARLQKMAEQRKTLETMKKQLAEASELERLRSRGELLEKHLREPMLLTNEDIETLLELLFRSDSTQRRINEMIAARKVATAEAGKADGKADNATPDGTESSDP